MDEVCAVMRAIVVQTVHCCVVMQSAFSQTGGGG